MAAEKRPHYDIDLRDFSAVGALLADHARRHYGACASFCFRRNRPTGPILLSMVIGAETRALSVGVHRITKSMKATLGDPDDAVEHGAYGVALLTAAQELGMRFLRRSFKGPGFDFHVTPPTTQVSDLDDIFADTWGFEVTGIMNGGDVAIRNRLRRKREQVAHATTLHPVLIAVIEFSQPQAVFELLSSL